jgi:putative hemolysin
MHHHRPLAEHPRLSYANDGQPPLRRLVIRSIEGLSGRRRYERLYDRWRSEIYPTGRMIFTQMLDLVGIRLAVEGFSPPDAQRPLVMVANHPFGIGDGLAMLSLAEQLGRPFRVMIHSDLLKVEEVVPFALPVVFEETREATQHNLKMRLEALKLLREGVVIVVFPAGGVATAPKVLGAARDLPWKRFPARLIREAQADVLPVFFHGQNGPLFHLVSRFSITLRLSLLVREFTRLSGRTIHARVGGVISWDQIAHLKDRQALIDHLHDAVIGLGEVQPSSSVTRTSTSWLRPGTTRNSRW